MPERMVAWLVLLAIALSEANPRCPRGSADFHSTA